MANGKADPQEVIDEVLAGNLTPYDTGTNFLEVVDHLAPGTRGQYLTMLGGKGKPRYGSGFLLTVFGKQNFDPDVFQGLIPTGDRTTQVSKESPKLDAFKHIVRDLAGPRDKALLGVMGITGMRISEVVSRKRSDLEKRPDGYAKLRLPAKSTKKRYERPVFLTKEVVEWIEASQKGIQSEWLFAGELGAHLAKRSAYWAIKTLFRRAGLEDTEDYIYSPHSMRTFAISVMRKAGLQEGYIDSIVGHTSDTKRRYEPAEVEEEWVKFCANIEFLAPFEVVKDNPKLQAEVDDLKGKIKGLTEILKEYSRARELEKKSVPELEDKSKNEVGA